MGNSWWFEKGFQLTLLSFLCRDRVFLKKCGPLLSASDFSPGRDESDERYVIATLALQYWKKYREPVSLMLRTEVLDYCDNHNKSDKFKRLILEAVDSIVSGNPVAVEAMEDRIVKYVQQKMMHTKIEKLIDLQEKKELTTESFIDTCKDVVHWSNRGRARIVDLYDTLEHRISRRHQESTIKRPLLMIDDLDARTKGPTRGDLGLFVGPTKKGKSLGLLHISLAYALQGLSSIYYTFEDPVEVVEDRFDASIAYLPIAKLGDMPNKLRKRFKHFRRLLRGRIKVVDCRDGGIGINEMEEIALRERERGFIADATIADYDKEIVPRNKKADRRFQFEEIYTDFRQMNSRLETIGWTAAQSQRVKDNAKYITQNKTGEDIGKIQKATLAIGIGQGEYGDDSRYLYVMASKIGPMLFGVDIMASPSKGMFYDSERTDLMKKMIKAKSQQNGHGGEKQ